MSKLSTDNTKIYNSVFFAFSSCDVRLGSRVQCSLDEFQTGSLSPVDKESYRPSSVTTRNQLLSPSGSPQVGVYDFQDGKDTGLRPVRRPDLDRVQVDSIIKQKLADAESRARDAEAESLERARAKQEAQTLRQERISEIVEASQAIDKVSKGV